MIVDPLSGYSAQYGLRPVTLADQPLLNSYFKTLADPLSDYTFSQLFTWRNSLRILWRELEGHLCVFANGTGDLTLLLPPIGDTGSAKALAACWEIMDDYNVAHRVPDRGRIEYASEELLGRLDRARLDVQPMGTDYLYDVNRMIDLAGGDLASKRQSKNRFLRNYQSRAETYDRAKHFDGCAALLDAWKSHQDASHAMEITAGANGVKRQKEALATRLALETAHELGLKGMVVYVTNKPEAEGSLKTAADAPGLPESIKGFTFGENLGADQSSIVIEKTDLEIKGLTQFIFSDFCRLHFADRPLVNVGDDWGLETLAWTKMSYRPVKLLQKYVLGRPAKVQAGYETPPMPEWTPESMSELTPEIEHKAMPEPAPLSLPTTIRFARKDDLAAAVNLEQTCFDTYSISKRQLQYIHSRPHNVFLIAEQDGQIVGQAIALVRHHKHGVTGRVYSLAVKGECRGQKIGRNLMRQLIDELASRGVRKTYLEVEQANTNAVKLYESLGFRATEPLADYYGEGRPGWHMAREVEAQPELFQSVA